MWTALGILTVAAAAALMARLMRATGLPGGAVIGGMIVGLVLGPSIFGRVAPDQFAEIFEGGTGEAHEQLNALLALREQAAVDPVITAPSLEQLAAAQDAWDQQRWNHQLPVRISVAIFVCVMLLAGTPGRLSQARTRVDPGWLAPISIGLWAALLPGGLAFIALRAALDFSLTASLLAASALAIGPWAMSVVDHTTADRAEFGGALLLRRSAIVASTAALGTIAYATHAANQLSMLAWFSPVSLVIILAAGISSTRRIGIDITRQLLMPILTAIALLRVDLLEAFAFWPVLLVLLLSGDGRWTGAFLGAMLPGGRRGLRTMRLVMPAMAAGPTQLAVAAIATVAWMIPQDLTLALLLGVLAIEASAPVREATVDRLLEVEDELQQS